MFDHLGGSMVATSVLIFEILYRINGARWLEVCLMPVVVIMLLQE